MLFRSSRRLAVSGVDDRRLRHGEEQHEPHAHVAERLGAADDVQVEIGKPFEPNKLYRGMRSVSHPSWWVHKQAYLTAGPYQSQFKIAMDYDMMCRLVHEPYAFFPLAMVRFDDSGISTNQYLRSLQENQQVYESYFGYSVKCRLWQLRLRLLHYTLQSYPGKVLFRLKRKLGGENW